MSGIESGAIDWRLTTWEGVKREQLRRWSELPLERIVLAQEEMQDLADRLSLQAPTRDVITQVIRGDDRLPDMPSREMATPESRMSAVWELTLQCMAWQPGAAGEPRLQRSVVRIQRAQR